MEYIRVDFSLIIEIILPQKSAYFSLPKCTKEFCKGLCSGPYLSSDPPSYPFQKLLNGPWNHLTTKVAEIIKHLDGVRM